jgi:hypothetical protein
VLLWALGALCSWWRTAGTEGGKRSAAQQLRPRVRICLSVVGRRAGRRRQLRARRAAAAPAEGDPAGEGLPRQHRKPRRHAAPGPHQPVVRSKRSRLHPARAAASFPSTLFGLVRAFGLSVSRRHPAHAAAGCSLPAGRCDVARRATQGAPEEPASRDCLSTLLSALPSQWWRPA